jgi:NAD(P)H-dependent flavin oxidoreductase YrpB (nitropropane dioxygenase family)
MSERAMLKSKFCDAIGVKHPIIQAGMGPFGTNRLCIAAAKAGVLGLISASGVDSRLSHPEIYRYFVGTCGAGFDDDKITVLNRIFRQTLEATRERQGIFGLNTLVSEEFRQRAIENIGVASDAREADPEMKERFRVMVTSAGDPLPLADLIKEAGFKWIHVVPSVQGALRCGEAGVDIVVASGHEGGFHTAWEPVHSLVLLPAVVDALAGSGIPVIGAGGFCDGRSLAAAFSLGASGVQMGTRFLTTQESDFVPLWKDGIIKSGDRGTLIARGFVGPARFLKTPATQKHAEDSIAYSPGVYLGKPDDLSRIPPEILKREIDGINAIYEGDEDRALLAGGECAQRIEDLPTVESLVDRIVVEASRTIADLPGRLADC